MDEIARSFLETYAKGGQPEGGWKFAKALQQSQLDHSGASLARLDQLFSAIRERGKPTADEDENADGAKWRVPSYDGTVELQGQRHDAVLVLLYTYGKSPLRM